MRIKLTLKIIQRRVSIDTTSKLDFIRESLSENSLYGKVGEIQAFIPLTPSSRSSAPWRGGEVCKALAGHNCVRLSQPGARFIVVFTKTKLRLYFNNLPVYSISLLLTLIFAARDKGP